MTYEKEIKGEFCDTYESKGEFLRMKVKRFGEGNSATTKIKIESDQGEDFIIQIVGEWEWDDFVSGINKVNKEIKQPLNGWDF